MLLDAVICLGIAFVMVEHVGSSCIAGILVDGVMDTYIICKKKTSWSESASELYRSSDRRLSAK
jgi:GrpB-like predicted nucleotidyltransferase (UPF0157 family)